MSGTNPAPLNRVLATQSVLRTDGRRDVSIVATDGNQTTILAYLGDFTEAEAPVLRDLVLDPASDTPRALFIVQTGSAAAGTLTSNIWQTDGTAAGTEAWDFENRGDFSHLAPDSLVRFGDRLAFTSLVVAPGSTPDPNWDGVRRLWVMEEDGSLREHYIAPVTTSDDGSKVGYGNPTGLMVVGDTLYFAANGGFPNGRELYAIDGDDPNGSLARLVKDVAPFSFDTPAPPQWYEEAAYFAYRLFEAGLSIAGFFGNALPISLVTPFDYLKFALKLVGMVVKFTYAVLVSTGVAQDIQRYLEEQLLPEGTNPNPLAPELLAQTRQLLEDGNDDYYANGLPFPDFLTPVGDGMVFRGSTPVLSRYQPELWFSDGTTEGTAPLKSNTCALISDPSNFMALPGNRLVFMAQQPEGVGLFVTDGTQAGTAQIAGGIRLAYSLEKASSVIIGNKVVFAALGPGGEGFELWASDGTPGGRSIEITGGRYWAPDSRLGGPVLLKDIAPGEASSLPTDFVAIAGGALFTAGDETRQVWFTDGTPEGTRLALPSEIQLRPLGLIHAPDFTPPDTLADAVPLFSNGAGMELSGSTDALDAATVRIFLTSPGLDPLDVTAPVVGGRWSHDFASLPEGRWTAFVRATDLSGNEDGSPAIIRFTVDRTAPQTSVPAPLTLTNQASPVITGTADADAVSLTLTFAPMSFDPAGGGGFRTIEVPVLDGQWAATLPTLFASGAQGRSFEWSAVATDAAGNTDPTPVTGIFTLDLVAPDTTVSAGGATRATRGQLQVGVTSSDQVAGAGITLQVLRPDGTTVTEEFGGFFTHTRLLDAPMDGTYTFTAIARDLAGNADATPAVTSFTVTRPAGWEILFNDDFAPETTMQVVPGVAGSGLLRVSGTATDDARFPSGVGTVLLRVADQNNGLNPANLIIPVTVSGTSWQADVDLGGFAHGTLVRFDAQAVDRAGNTDRTPAFGDFTTVDRLAPEAAITVAGVSAGRIGGSTPGFTDAAEIRLRLVSPTGIESFATVVPDNSGSKNGVWSYDLPQPVDGAWTVFAQAVDRVGNADLAPTQAVVVVDTTVPDTVLAPLDAAIPGFVLSGTPGDAVAIRYTLTGGGSGTTGPVITVPADTATILPPTPGFWRLEAVAVDAAGNADPTPLVATLSLPGNTRIDTADADGTLRGRAPDATQVRLTLEAPDGQVLERVVPVEDSFFNTPSGPVFAGRFWTYKITEDQGGSWTITARGIGPAGHLDPIAATVSAQIEPVPDTGVDPVAVAPLLPSLGTGAVQITGTATPGVARDVEALFTAPDGSIRAVGGTVAPDGTWFARFQPGQEGSWTVSATARNQFGAADATPAVASFLVDLTAPTTTLQALPSFTTDADILLSGTASPDAVKVRILSNSSAVPEFEAPVVNGAWTARIANIPEGNYTFRATVYDAAGNFDPVASPQTGTSVLRTVPDTGINPIAALVGNFTNLQIGGTITSGANTGVELLFTRPDGSTFTANGPLGGSGWGYTLVAPQDGLWRFEAAGRNIAGGLDATPAIASFTVDRTAPGLGFDTYPTLTRVAAQTFSGTTAADAVSVTLRLEADGLATRFVTAAVVDGAWTATLADLPDGGWNISGRALDAVGNLGGWVAAPRLVLDSTAPETEVLENISVYVIPAATNAAGIRVAGGFESAGTTESWVVITLTAPDGTPSETIVTRGMFAQWDRTLSLPQEGVWQLSVAERDTAGNVDATPFQRSILVDRTGPDARIEAIADNNGSFLLRGTTDPDAVSVTITGPGAGSTTLPVFGGQWSLPVAGLTSGLKQVTVTARDWLGNADATPATASFTVDATAPTSRLVSIGGMSSLGLEAPATHREALTFTGTAASDAAWVVFDLRKPDGETVAMTAPVAGGAWSLSVPVAEEGAWRVLGGTAVDGFGNRGVAMILPAQQDFLVDRTAPETSFSTAVAAYNPGTIPAIGTDSGAGPRAVSLEFTRPDGVVVTNPANLHTLFTFPDGFSRDGTWIVRAFAEDRAGNRDASPAVASFIIDGTKPVTTIDPGLEPVTSTTLLQMSGTSSADGVLAELTYSGPGTTSIVTVPVTDGRWAHDFAPLAEGRWSVTVRTQDIAGNWSNGVEARPGGFAIDRAAPETWLFDPPDTRGASMTLTGRTSWSTEGAGSFEVAAKREASLVRLTLTGPDDAVITRDLFPREILTVNGTTYFNGWKADLTTLAEGSWQFSAATMNNNGVLDPTPVTGTFVIDRGNPDTAIAGPEEVATALTTYTLSGTATPGFATQVRILLMPEGLGLREILRPVDADGNWTVTLTGLAADRRTLVSVQAEVRTGATDPTPALMVIRQDQTAPDTRILTPEAGTHLRAPGFEVTGNVSAADATAVTVRFAHPDGTTLTRDLTLTADGQWSTTLEDAAEGTWTVTATARDETGNADATPATRIIILDRTAPDTFIAPITGAVAAPFAVVSGTLSAGEAGSVALTFQRPDGTGFTATASAADGSWRYTLPTLVDGTWLVSALGTDLAGNTDATPAFMGFDVFYPRPDAVVSVPDFWRSIGFNTSVDVSETVTRVHYVLTSPDGVVRQSFSTNWNPADTGFVTFQNTIPEGPDGLWTLTATAEDVFGTRDETPATAVVKVDRTPPETGIATAAWVVADGVARITGTASADATDIFYVLTPPGGTEPPRSSGAYSRLTPEADGSWSITAPDLAEGMWTITAYARDGASLVDATSATTTFVVDRTAPETLMDALPALVNGAGTLVRGTVTGSDAVSVALTATRFGSTPITATVDVTDGAWSWQFVPSADGNWTISAAARDAVGNVDATPAGRSIVTDATPPATPTSFTRLDTDLFYQSQVTVTVPFDSAVSQYLFTFTMPDGATETVTRSSGFTYAVPAGAPDGLFLVSVQTVDAAGNVSPGTLDGSIALDRTPPVLSPITTTWLPESRELEFSGTADTASVRLFLNAARHGDPDGPYWNFLSLQPVVPVVDGAWSHRLLEPGDRPWQYRLAATDAFGRESLVGTQTVLPDTTRPDTGMDALPPLGALAGVVVTGTATLADATIVMLAATGPGGATVTAEVPVADGSWTWNFVAPAAGVWSITATARDAAGNRDATPVTASIDIDNFPAITSDGAASFAENDTGIVYQAQGSDWDGGAVTWSLGGADAALFTVDALGAVRFAQAPDFEAPRDAGANNGYDILVIAEGGARSISRAVTIAVTNVNDVAPAITSGETASFAENGTGIAYAAMGTDPEGAALTWSLDGADAALFTVDADGAVRFRVAPDFEAPADADGDNAYEIEVIASDGELTTMRAVTITVTNVNDVAPVITSGETASFAENGTGIAYAALGNDPEGAALTWSLDGADAALFTVDANGAVRFRVAPDFEAPADADGDNAYSINVVASDGGADTSRAVTITVTNVNDVAPVITSGETASFAENGTGAAYAALGSDPEGATLEWSLGGTDAALFTVDADGAVRFRVAPDFEAPADADGDNAYEIEVIASDGELTTTSAVTITVTNVNDVAPLITSGDTASVAENDTGTAYAALGDDPEGAGLEWSLGGADAALFAVDEDGAVRFRVAPDFEAPQDADGDNAYKIDVTASDGELTTTRAVTIQVTNVNEVAPVITSAATASFTENGTGVAYRGAATDGDGDALTWSLGGADEALFTVNAAGEVRFRAAPDFEAPRDADGDNAYALTITATDGLNSASRSVTVTVLDVNDAAPVITAAATLSVPENTSGIILRPMAVDPEGAAIIWSLGGTDAALFQIDGDGALRFRAPPDFEAPGSAAGDNLYRLNLIASDGTLSTSHALVVSVTDLDDVAPVITSPAAMRFLENGTGIVHQARASDAGGRPVTWSLAGTDAALFTIDAAGALRFRATPDFEAPRDAGADNRHDLTLIASAGGPEATQALEITVVNVDEAPVITSAGVAGFLENLGGVAFQGAAFDPEGAALSWSLSGVDAGLFRLDPLTGGLRFITAPNFEAPLDNGADGAFNLVLTASDGRLSTAFGVDIYLSNDGFEGNAILFGSRPLDNNFGGRMLGRNTTDVMYGADGDDVLVGLGGDDFFDGGTTRYVDRFTEGPTNAPTGNDLFDPGAGNDTFIGGDGTDSVVYRQNATAQTVSLESGTTYTVTETAGTVDWLTDVELAYFNNGVWNLVTNTFTPYGFTLTAAASQAEGSTTPYSFTLTRTGFVDSAAEFLWRVDAGTATAADFAGGALPWGTVSFAAGQASVVIPVLVAADALAELDETFTLRIMREIGGEFGVSMDLVSRAGAITNGDAAALIFTSGPPAPFTAGGTGIAYQAQAAHSVSGTPIAWSLGGVDGALFTIDATGALRFRDAPDFGAPLDAGVDNVYDVEVIARGGGLTTVMPIAIAVARGNTAPVITSAATAGFAENGSGIAYQAAGFDPDPGTTLLWSLGGVDATLFEISDSGAVTFRTAPDFEAPADAGQDNVYDITITVSDGVASGAPRLVAITVTDVAEVFTLVGGRGPDVLLGSPVMANRLSGGAGNDRLVGGAGADSLNGGTGADLMEGGAGNDAYSVDSIQDVVTELAGGGYDRVTASVHWTLGAETERLILSGTANLNGTGNALDNRLDGNAGANILDGGAGDDTLIGGAGDDTLIGGAGNDTHWVDDAGDLVVELPDGGYDHVRASISHTLGAEVERLSLSGTAPLNGTGNALDNRLDGNAGANILDGGAGHDTLIGGAGDDTLVGGLGNDRLDGGLGADALTGGAGNDVFRFVQGQAQGDVVMDFTGNGPSTGDRLEFRGYGTAEDGADFARIDATTWRITSADGVTEEVITFANAAVLHPSDWSFL